MNCQAVKRGKCSKGQLTTKQSYRDALKCAGLCDQKGDTKTSDWIECLKAKETLCHQTELRAKTLIIQKKKKEKETEK